MSTQPSSSVRLKMEIFAKEPWEWTTNANKWFASLFPEAAALYGAPFLSGTYKDANDFSYFYPVMQNSDFWAASLAGDLKNLGYRMIYFEPEETFYFLDPLQRAYCRTTEVKIEALMSNLLVRCAESCGRYVNIENMMILFREPKMLQRIIRRAKALLAADRSFFEGEHGNPRIIDGNRIEPNAKPGWDLFVDKAVVVQPGNPFTVADAFSRYFQFCQYHQLPVLTRPEFRAFASEKIRERFSIGLRRDVISEAGTQREGWIGIGSRSTSELFGVN